MRAGLGLVGSMPAGTWSAVDTAPPGDACVLVSHSRLAAPRNLAIRGAMLRIAAQTEGNGRSRRPRPRLSRRVFVYQPGKTTVARVPEPGSLTIPTSPRCTLTNSATIARPIPLPADISGEARPR